MSDWLRKIKKNASEKQNESEEMEDFVLYRDEADVLADRSEAELSAETEQLDRTEARAEENTFTCPEEEAYFAPAMQTEQSTEMIQTSKKGFLAPILARDKKSLLFGSGIVVGALALVAVLIFACVVLLNPLHGYTEVTVAKGNVIPSVNTSGVLEANAYYSITSLVSGTVKESKPEVGDRVEAGEVLYKLDDEEAQLALKRAQNQLDKSKAIGGTSKTSTSRIYAGESGVLQTINIQVGSSVSAGQIVATILKGDGSAVSVTSSVSGTVASVIASRGRSVTAGTMLATVTDDSVVISQKSNSYDQKSNEYDVEAAKKQLENYTIKAPVSGVITQKNAKVGDNVAITNMEHPMMVLVDMNSMKFTFTADEKQVMDYEVGQNAIITTDSIPNETFAGEITRVSGEGKTDEEGNVRFEVDVTIEEPGDLKAGMTVNAKIILDSATNVMYLPKEALLEADGERAVVLVKKDELAESSDDEGGASDAELEYPWIKVPKGCELVSVKYGITDGTNVEIISGLAQGKIVVYNPKWETNELVPSTPKSTPSPAKIEDNAESAEDAAVSVPNTSAVAEATDERDEMEDEELKRQIQQKIQERQNAEGDTPNVTKKPIGVTL